MRCKSKRYLLIVMVFMLVVSACSIRFLPFLPQKALAASNDALEQTIEDLINWKKSDVGSTPEQPLINDEFLKLAGSTPGDWFPIGLGRYGYQDDYLSYLAVITDYVNTKYQEKGKLHAVKATEWHRISLAINAAGGDPYKIGNFNGEPINLIEDGTYNRGLTASPGRQGINGWIWSLISLDSKRYVVPSDAYHQRQDFIVEILKAQLADGGLSLSSSVSDPDITAMAIQALAPYYNSEIEYEYTSSKIKEKDENDQWVYEKRKKTVKQVVDEEIAWLSSVQTDDGDFCSWGTQNLESTCQVVVALTALGINPLTDSRFITESGKTLLDGIMKYRLENGGFIHSFTYDPDNPTSKPNEANTMASEQALYTLVALRRHHNGMRTLYDMRDEFSPQEKTEIDNAISAIESLSEVSSLTEVESALDKYVAVEATNRSYVTNYWELSDLCKKFELALPEEKSIFSGNGTGNDGFLTYFAPSDEEQTLALPAIEELTTANYVEVVTLFEKLKNAENKENCKEYYPILEKAYRQIESIQAEIDDIKADIRDQLYPFGWIGLNKRNEVHQLYDRYMALSDYDRTQFEKEDIEGLNKCKTQVDNLFTALIISVCCATVAAGITVWIVFHIKKRRRLKRENQMQESDE